MAPAVQRVDGDHADARAVGAVFTHQAVRVGPVWEVFGHEGNGDGDLRQVLGGTLDLGESRGPTRRFTGVQQATFHLERPSTPKN